MEITEEISREIDADAREERNRESQMGLYESWLSDNHFDLKKEFEKEKGLTDEDEFSDYEDEFSEYCKHEFNLWRNER